MLVNPFPPMSVKWHLKILLCLTPDDLLVNGEPLREERLKMVDFFWSFPIGNGENSNAPGGRLPSNCIDNRDGLFVVYRQS